MRATSPSGSAAYEGEVQWSGELGYGARAAEGGQSGRRDDAATGSIPLRTVLEPHLLPEDIPFDRKGMRGARGGPRSPPSATSAASTPPASAAVTPRRPRRRNASGQRTRGREVSTLALLAAAGTAATIPDLITFVVSALVILIGAIGVVTSRNPVHAALSLVLTLFGVAVLFVAEEANFLAAVQVIVYAGAIVVLFLFVIMFLGVDRRENLETEPLVGQRPLAFLAGLVILGGGVALVWTDHGATGAHAVAGPSSGGHANVYLLGQSVFTTYLFAFEATAALLVIAVVGAVVLARRPPVPTDEPDGLVDVPVTEPADAPGASSDAPVGGPGESVGDPALQERVEASEEVAG